MSSHAAQEQPDRYCPKCGRRLTRRRRTPDGRSHPACVCGYIQFTNPKVVAGTLPIRHGKVALLRRDLEPSMGLWTFPAGFVDRGETPLDAAVRETLEECGLEVRVQRLLGLMADPGNPILVIAYLAAVQRGTLQARSECLEARWFSRSQIPWDQLAFPSTAAALKRWHSKRYGLLM